MPSPLVATAGWVVLVAFAGLSPTLAPLALSVAVFGEILLATLALHVVHEAGHVLAGMLVGLPFRRVSVWLFTLSRDPAPGGPVLRWGVNASWRRFAGCVERDVMPAPGKRAALSVAAAGGPLASLACGALLLHGPVAWHQAGYVSLLVGLVNVLPMTAFGQVSDGEIVRRLWSRAPADVTWRAGSCGADAGPHLVAEARQWWTTGRQRAAARRAAGAG